MKLEGIEVDSRAFLSKECLGLKKPHAKVVYEQKNAREGCHINTVNISVGYKYVTVERLGTCWAKRNVKD